MSSSLTFLSSFGVSFIPFPGGGGYTIRNVARCWAYETAALLGHEVPDELPKNNPYYEYFGPEYRLSLRPDPEMDNANSKEDLDRVRRGAEGRGARPCTVSSARTHSSGRRRPRVSRLSYLSETLANE
jgi:hypothetical protein